MWVERFGVFIVPVDEGADIGLELPD